MYNSPAPPAEVDPYNVAAELCEVTVQALRAHTTNPKVLEKIEESLDPTTKGQG
jgi:hypothetical protein